LKINIPQGLCYLRETVARKETAQLQETGIQKTTKNISVRFFSKTDKCIFD